MNIIFNVIEIILLFLILIFVVRNKSKDYNLNSFNDGANKKWLLIQIAIFDLYKNLEILDYFSLITSIANRCNDLIKNDTVLTQKLMEFEHFIIESNKETINDNDNN